MIAPSLLRLVLAGSAFAALVAFGAYAHRTTPQDTAGATLTLPCSSCDARHAAFTKHMEQQEGETE